MARYRYTFSGKIVEARPATHGTEWIVYIGDKAHVYSNEEFATQFTAVDPNPTATAVREATADRIEDRPEYTADSVKSVAKIREEIEARQQAAAVGLTISPPAKEVRAGPFVVARETTTAAEEAAIAAAQATPCTAPVPPLVYICAPFTADTPWQIEQNVRVAEEMAFKVARLGGWPVCPHTNTRFFFGAVPTSLAYAGTLEMMRRCDVVLVHKDWPNSTGCCTEVNDAGERKIWRCFSFGALGCWITDSWPKLLAERTRALERCEAGRLPPPPPPAPPPPASSCEISRLERYILKNFPSEPGRGTLLDGVGPAPNRSESAVDTAIRLLRCLRTIASVVGVRA
jgi:hypothetical protein